MSKHELSEKHIVIWADLEICEATFEVPILAMTSPKGWFVGPDSTRMKKMIESTLTARHVFRVAALQKSPWSINWLVPRDPKGVSKLQECFLKPCYMLPIAAMYGDINLLLPLRPAANGSSSPKDLGKLAEGWRLLLLLFGFLGSLSYSAWYPKLRKSFCINLFHQQSCHLLTLMQETGVPDSEARPPFF